MSTCRDCDATIVWLKDTHGRYLPPFEPTLDFANGEYVTAVGDGIAAPIPQVYKKHRCPNARFVKREVPAPEEPPEEPEPDWDDHPNPEPLVERAKGPPLRARESILDYQGLDRIREQNRRFTRPRKALGVACPDCGAEVDEPCRHPTLHWVKTPHAGRRALTSNGRLRPRHPGSGYWGDDYVGPWPPPLRHQAWHTSGGYFAPGVYTMQTFLRDNYALFQTSDEWMNREWLLGPEIVKMKSWLREHGSILWEEI